MKDAAKKFRKAISYDTVKGVQYNPDNVAKVIQKDQSTELAEILKGTPNEKLIAFSDPKVRELINYIIAAIIRENEKINSVEGSFPIEICRRYKSSYSLKNKIDQKDEVTDYLGFRIVPETEHEIFFSKDPVLQKMIKRRENVRDAMVKIYKKLSDSKGLTFEDYCKMCGETLDRLKEVFVDKSIDSNDYAIERHKYYDEIKERLDYDLEDYNATLETTTTKLSLDEILTDCTAIDIRILLSELGKNLNNEVNLYQLTRNLEQVFQNSSLLDNLRNIYICQS